MSVVEEGPRDNLSVVYNVKILKVIAMAFAFSE